MKLDFNDGVKLKEVDQNFLDEWGVENIHSLMFISDAKIKNTSQVMFLEVNIGGHEVLLVYKYVKLMKVQFIRLLHCPITKPRDITLENKILRGLSKHPQVQEIVTSEDDYREHKIAIPTTPDLYADDFFDILDEELVTRVNKGKRRSKIKYTKYKDRINFRKANQDDYLDIINLMQTWMKNKEDNKDLFNKKTFNTVEKKFPMLLQDPFSIYVTTFDDEIIAFEVFAREGDRVVQLVNQAQPSAECLQWDEDLSKEIHAYCLKWHHLLTINEFIKDPSIRLIHYEYASRIGGGLHNFKCMMYSNKVHLIRMKFRKE